MDSELFPHGVSCNIFDAKKKRPGFDGWVEVMVTPNVRDTIKIAMMPEIDIEPFDDPAIAVPPVPVKTYRLIAVHGNIAKYMENIE